MRKSEIGRRQFTKLALLHILLIFVFVLPYYTFARVRIIKKIEISNINFVTNEIYAGKSKLERAIIGGGCISAA
jgi:cell division septal protein FtsQ